jgi:hypothetical protein
MECTWNHNVMSFHPIRSNHEFNLSEYWMPSLGSRESWEIVFGCHEDAAKVELSKSKEKEGRKKEMVPIWVSKLDYSHEKFHFETSQDMIPQCLTHIACNLAAGPSAHSSSGIQLKVYVCMYTCTYAGASNWQNQSASRESTSNISCTGKKLTSFEKKYHWGQ